MNPLLAPVANVRTASARWCSVCAALFLVLLMGSQESRAQGCRPQDDLWFIDTRPAACNAKDELGLPKVSAERRLSDNRWHRSSLTEFLAEDPSMPTIIWVHGNRIEGPESRQRGWEFYYKLTRHADPSPLRVVIWSWPADQVRGPLNDIRYKAMLTEPAAYHLGQVLVRMNPEQHLGLVGFSYGARIITGALHLQAGGRLGSKQLALPKDAMAGPTSTVVLWASALNHDWLLPGRYHGESLEQISQVTLLNNPCDRALKRYHLTSRCSNPTALGYVGLASQCLAENQYKVVQQNVSCQVGEVHTSTNYIQSPSVMLSTWQGLQMNVALAKKSEPGEVKTVSKVIAKSK